MRFTPCRVICKYIIVRNWICQQSSHLIVLHYKHLMLRYVCVYVFVCACVCVCVHVCMCICSLYVCMYGIHTYNICIMHTLYVCILTYSVLAYMMYEHTTCMCMHNTIFYKYIYTAISSPSTLLSFVSD